jgi:hypothetical protein
MIRVITEWKRKRDLKKYFTIRFFRERHEIYLRAVAAIGAVEDKSVPGITVYSILFEAPTSMQVDMSLTARMLQALKVDGLVKTTAIPPPTDPPWMASIHARYQLTCQGEHFLDQWWVKRTLQKCLVTEQSRRPIQA